MISYFPTFYEDELLYSLFSRYYQKTGYTTYRDAAQDLFKNMAVRPDIEFMNQLTDDALNRVKKIKPIEQVILENTMYAYYGRFLKSDRRNNAYESLVNMTGNHRNLLLMRNNIGNGRYLRYCPLCSKEHRELYGETYWMRIERIQKKPKKERTPEEEARLKEIAEQKKQKNSAISILRGISIRIPLLIYGADIDFDEDITMEKLVDIVDDSSWDEFMPAGVSKELFKRFIKYYDAEVFVAAGRKIRNTVKSADELPPTERVQKITELFSHFKNPDKETVLTPWRVVNMHMSDCLGGYDFFDTEHQGALEEPRFVDRGKVTAETLAKEDARILEINSKTGLYPLYVTYSLYRRKVGDIAEVDYIVEIDDEKWKETVKNNVFVVCKTEMAKSITKRTLMGYKSGTGMMIMMNGTIRTMEVFAGTVKSAMEAVYGSECRVDVHKVVKNNGLHLTGITIRNRESNMAPTIYLDGYFADYKDGRTMENICKEIVQVYEKNKVQKDFSLEQVADFDNVKGRICFKLVNREKNAELLADAPYVEYQDLAVIFYILVSKDNTGTASITVRTTLQEMWGVDTDILYDLAKKNTQRLFRGRVSSMMEVMAEIIGDSADTLDEGMAEAFFDIDVYEDSAFPMYVATNVSKMNGAWRTFRDVQCSIFKLHKYSR